MKLQAVLLDVGGVLADETEFYTVFQERLLETLEQEGFFVSPGQLMKLLERLWRRNISNYPSAILWHFAKPDVDRLRRLRERLWHLRESSEGGRRRPVPGAREVVSTLSQKYQLALAGNQPATVKAFLEAQGLLDYFKSDLVSEELGLAKPDPLFFQVILDRLGVEPQEAVMVGDRLDNDVFPAKLLGMRTIRVLAWPFTLQKPRIFEEQPDLTVQELLELPAAVEELSH